MKRCPFCDEPRPWEAFLFVQFFSPWDRRLQDFCRECASTLMRAAERKSTHSRLTFDDCLDRYIAAVKAAFDERETA